MTRPIRTGVKDLAELRHAVVGSPRIFRSVQRTYERRYHATWMRVNGMSPLSTLGAWMYQHRSLVHDAPLDLLAAAAADVSARLPLVAAREPTRRHRKHFAWLLGWQMRIAAALQSVGVIRRTTAATGARK